MRRALIGLLCALSSASCRPVLEGKEYDLAGQEVRLTFLHTSDIHSRLIPYDFAPLKTDTDLGLLPEAGPFGGATALPRSFRDFPQGTTLNPEIIRRRGWQARAR